tara:strand:- start:735 stop:1472 length:738 start_codon:yes stop_codon:yes gene_type:complete
MVKVVDYINANFKYWAQGVYDNPNPESYVFRIYGRVLADQFNLPGSDSARLLDFGCGSGGNLRFFDERGFDVFGVDQSSIDIDRSQRRIPHKADQMKTISPVSSVEDRWFGDTKFEVITAFQSLYYMDDSDLQTRLASLYDMLEHGGIVIATMMHSSCWYYGMSEPADNGLRLVRFRRDQDIGRPNLKHNDHFINFTEDENDLISKFALFKPLHTRGYYDGVYRDDQGSEKHLIFIGQKLAAPER